MFDVNCPIYDAAGEHHKINRNTPEEALSPSTFWNKRNTIPDDVGLEPSLGQNTS